MFTCLLTYSLRGKCGYSNCKIKPIEYIRCETWRRGVITRDWRPIYNSSPMVLTLEINTSINTYLLTYLFSGLNDKWPLGRPVLSQYDVAVGRTNRKDVARYTQLLSYSLTHSLTYLLTYSLTHLGFFLIPWAIRHVLVRHMKYLLLPITLTQPIWQSNSNGYYQMLH